MILHRGFCVDLRFKAVSGVIGIVILTAGILSLLSFTVILNNYLVLESDSVRGEMNLIGNNIAGDIQNLESNAPDWAAWDDTYAYVRGEQPDFPDVNLVNATFRTLRVKLDGCLTGAMLAKDRAAEAASRVMIPEALDYPQ